MSEHTEQAALFEWAEINESRYPELCMLYAVPNGGHRHKSVAIKLKAEGVKAGVWDISLDVARGQYNGLKIEMKFGKNQLTEEQRFWGSKYKIAHYQTAVCWSWTEAASRILWYLDYDIPEDLQ